MTNKERIAEKIEGILTDEEGHINGKEVLQLLYHYMSFSDLKGFLEHIKQEYDH